jgi:hypothetical protein
MAATPLETYLATFATLGRERFLSTHHVPVLVQGFSEENETNTNAKAFETRTLDTAGIARLLATISEQSLVYPLSKSPGAAFAERVFVGRAINADISLPFAQVSKTHAYFTWNPERTQYFLTDVGATNGTVVNGKKLAPNQSEPLGNVATVSFGKHDYQFYVPSAFYASLEKLAAKRPKTTVKK